MNSLATNLQPEKLLLEIIQGPEKGAKFEIFASEIRIGRDANNDIVISDAKSSRVHALIRITPREITVEDLKSQNGTLLDGQKITKTNLKSQSVIQIGNTKILFKKVQPIQTTVFQPQQLGTGTIQGRKVSNSNNGKRNFYIILFSVLGLGYWLSQQPNTSTNLLDSKTSIDQEIETSQKRLDDLTRQQSISGQNSRQYLDAQAAYMKGLRDYRESNFKNAVNSFSAAIAIFPEHSLARRYLRLSQSKLDEQIQILINEGNKAMEENKYSLAQSAFRNVMILISDPENKTFKEAKAKFDECTLLLRGAF